MAAKAAKERREESMNHESVALRPYTRKLSKDGKERVCI